MCLTCVCGQSVFWIRSREIHHAVFAKENSNTISKEKLVTSEEAYNGTKTLYDMGKAVFTIRRKDLNNFQGQYIGSTGLFNLVHEWLKIIFSTLESDCYEKLFEKDIEGQDIETYKTFVVPFDNTKLNLSMHNESVTPNKEKIIAIGDEEGNKD